MQFSHQKTDRKLWKRLSLLLLSGLALSGTASAQIEVVNTATAFPTGVSSTYTLPNFNPGADADKLIVAVNTQGVSGVGFAGNVEEVRFRGRRMSLVSRLPAFVIDDPQNAIFSLDNPGRFSGDIIITYIDNTDGCRIAAVSLERTVPGTSAIQVFNAEASSSINSIPLSHNPSPWLLPWLMETLETTSSPAQIQR